MPSYSRIDKFTIPIGKNYFNLSTEVQNKISDAWKELSFISADKESSLLLKAMPIERQSITTPQVDGIEKHASHCG